MKYISVIGSCNMDMIVESDIRPKAGETVMGKRLISVSYTHLTLPTTPYV